MARWLDPAIQDITKPVSRRAIPLRPDVMVKPDWGSQKKVVGTHLFVKHVPLGRCATESFIDDTIGVSSVWNVSFVSNVCELLTWRIIGVVVLTRFGQIFGVTVFPKLPIDRPPTGQSIVLMWAQEFHSIQKRPRSTDPHSDNMVPYCYQPGLCFPGSTP